MSYTIIIPKDALRNIRGITKLMKGINQDTIFNLKDKKELALRINTHLKDNIDNKVDVFGRPMTPLSPKTYNRKKPPRGGPSAIPLKDTGIMYEAMKFEVKDNIIKLINNTPYVIYHQEGTEDIPQRQIYPENGILSKKLQELLDKFVENRVQSNISKLIK